MMVDRLVDKVKDHIDALPGSAGYFPGKVHANPIIMPGSDYAQGPDGVFYASTPDAFDPLNPVQIIRCMSVNQMPRTGGSANWSELYTDMIELWYYAPDTEADKAVLREAMEAVRSSLNRVPFVGESGWGILSPANDRTFPTPTGEFFHAVYAVERFRFNET